MVYDIGFDAFNPIAEQYIEGREIYVGVIGNNRLTTFPAWEMNQWRRAMVKLKQL